jgi:hypothetical protein
MCNAHHPLHSIMPTTRRQTLKALAAMATVQSKDDQAPVSVEIDADPQDADAVGVWRRIRSESCQSLPAMPCHVARKSEEQCA